LRKGTQRSRKGKDSKTWEQRKNVEVPGGVDKRSWEGEEDSTRGRRPTKTSSNDKSNLTKKELMTEEESHRKSGQKGRHSVTK